MSNEENIIYIDFETKEVEEPIDVITMMNISILIRRICDPEIKKMLAYASREAASIWVQKNE